MVLNHIDIEGLVTNLKSWPKENKRNSVLRFRLGNSRKGLDKGYDWCTVKIFGESAHAASTHLQNGDVVNVSGQLYQDTWTKDNVKKEEVVIRSLKCRVIKKTEYVDDKEGFVPLETEEELEPVVVAEGDDIPFGD